MIKQVVNNLRVLNSVIIYSTLCHIKDKYDSFCCGTRKKIFREMSLWFCVQTDGSQCRPRLLATSIPQNILICVLQKIQSYTGLELHIWVNYSIKPLGHKKAINKTHTLLHDIPDIQVTLFRRGGFDQAWNRTVV